MGKSPFVSPSIPRKYANYKGPIDPFYLMVPRLSYFPLCTDKVNNTKTRQRSRRTFIQRFPFLFRGNQVRKHFIRHIQQSDSRQDHEMWLEFNGIPLKWHYPIGVLLDIYSNDVQLPWNIVVHFERFPENVLMHCQNK